MEISHEKGEVSGTKPTETGSVGRPPPTVSLTAPAPSLPQPSAGIPISTLKMARATGEGGSKPKSRGQISPNSSATSPLSPGRVATRKDSKTFSLEQVLGTLDEIQRDAEANKPADYISSHEGDNDENMGEDAHRFVKINTPYAAQNNEELTVLTGDIVEMLSRRQMANDGWWTGKVRNHVGLFPSSYSDAVPPALEARLYLAIDDTHASVPGTAAVTKGEWFEVTERREGMLSGRIRSDLVLVPTASAVSLADFLLGKADASGASPASTPAPKARWEIDFAKISLAEVIGHGGFSEVRVGTYEGQQVAVKLLFVQDQPGQEMEQKLRAEADMLFDLRHRNIVGFIGACSVLPNLCIVMEYVPGGSLSRRLVSTLDPALLIKWAAQIADAMRYLHDGAVTPVIHRDLKSANILIAADDVLKISDFGLARHHHHTTRMTAAGTFAWMAPEVIRSNMFSKAADVWSYGVVLWEMLTGQTPYKGVEPMAIAYGVATGKLTLFVPHNCPAPFSQLLRQCWQQDPHDRTSFNDIVYLFQNAKSLPFTGTPRASLIDLQGNWKVEIQHALDAIPEQELAMTQEKPPEVDMQAQLDGLMAREEALRRRETDLATRELVLLLESQRALTPHRHKVQKKASPSTSVLGFFNFAKKKIPRVSRDVSISSPTDFKHLGHISGVSAERLSPAPERHPSIGALSMASHSSLHSDGVPLSAGALSASSYVMADAELIAPPPMFAGDGPPPEAPLSPRTGRSEKEKEKGGSLLSLLHLRRGHKRSASDASTASKLAAATPVQSPTPSGREPTPTQPSPLSRRSRKDIADGSFPRSSSQSPGRSPLTTPPPIVSPLFGHFTSTSPVLPGSAAGSAVSLVAQDGASRGITLPPSSPTLHVPPARHFSHPHSPTQMSVEASSAVLAPKAVSASPAMAAAMPEPVTSMSEPVSQSVPHDVLLARQESEDSDGKRRCSF